MKNKKTLFILLPIVLILVIAYFTKPDNKQIIIDSVTRIWGRRTPNPDKPLYYDEFMDINSKSVRIDDWVILKRVRYKIGDQYKTIGFAAFKHTYFTSVFM